MAAQGIPENDDWLEGRNLVMLNRMKALLMRVVLGVLALAVGLPMAWSADGELEGVTKKKGEILVIRNGKTSPLEDEIKLPFGVLVSTNGTFKVEKGKDRPIEEGQVVRADGNLLNADGSIQPVFDHFAIKLGKVIEVIDGQATPLAGPRNMADGSVLNPNGVQALPGGRKVQLNDGQLLKPDGSWLPIKETVSLKDGKVVVQKDGALFVLKSFQIMGTSDGTKVQGDGTVTLVNGKVIKLTENQTVLIDGPLMKR